MIEYRRDHAIDNDEYNQLRLRAWGREYGFDWAPVLARSLGWITARVHDHLIGFVNVAWDGGCHMFLLDTTVDPEFQRRGIGSELVRRALDMGAQAGGEWMHVDSDEILMRDFYGHCGFSPTPAGLAYLPALRTQGAALKTTRLEGGARWPVTREGEVVYKAAGPWTPAVHALLRHLEVAGFRGAPRLVGSGVARDGREVLTFIEGSTNHPGAWSREGVVAVGRPAAGAARRVRPTPPFARRGVARFDDRIPDGRRALLIGHSGELEPALVACFPNADHPRWGPAF